MKVFAVVTLILSLLPSCALVPLNCPRQMDQQKTFCQKAQEDFRWLVTQ